MDSNILTSGVMVLHNVSRLIFSPYTTMRRIVKEQDFGQIGIIFALVYVYFMYANIIRERTLQPFVISASSIIPFVMFLVTFLLTTSFFYVMGKMLSVKNIQFKKFLFVFAYSVIPTLVWFFATSTLFYLFPPPRTPSFLGQLFSLIFITYSITLFLWRCVLLYLSVRFTLKTSFYSTIALIVLFSVWFIPYSLGMYSLKIFRIPFI